MGGRSFELPFVVRKEDLYVVAVKYGDRFYELRDKDPTRKFAAKHVDENGNVDTCTVTLLTMAYCDDAHNNNISPNAFFEALNFFGKEDNLCHHGTFDRSGWTKSQEHLEAFFWFFSEVARFKPIFKDVLDGFRLPMYQWEVERKKSTTNLRLIKEWSNLSQILWAVGHEVKSRARTVLATVAMLKGTSESTSKKFKKAEQSELRGPSTAGPSVAGPSKIQGSSVAGPSKLQGPSAAGPSAPKYVAQSSGGSSTNTKSVEGMKLVCQDLAQATAYPEGSVIDSILKDANRLLSCFANKIAKTFDFSLVAAASTSHEYVMNTLMQNFQNKRHAHAVNESSQVVRALNVLVLNILDNRERMSSLSVLISLFRPPDPSRWSCPPIYESLSSWNQKVSDLVVICLIMLTKDLRSRKYEVELECIFQSIHIYIDELRMDGLQKRRVGAGTDDKQFLIFKTVLYENLKLCGTAIKGPLSVVSVDMQIPPINLNLQPELAATLKKISEKQTCSIGLYELYHITQFFQVDILSQLQNAREAFRSYIRDGLAKVERNAAAGRTPTRLPLSTTPPVALNLFQRYDVLSPVNQFSDSSNPTNARATEPTNFSLPPPYAEDACHLNVVYPQSSTFDQSGFHHDLGDFRNMLPSSDVAQSSGGNSTSTKIFQSKRHAHAVKESSQLLRALNVLMLKILDNRDRILSLSVLISILRPPDPSRWPYPPTNESLSAWNQRLLDLVVICWIMLTKMERNAAAGRTLTSVPLSTPSPVALNLFPRSGPLSPVKQLNGSSNPTNARAAEPTNFSLPPSYAEDARHLNVVYLWGSPFDQSGLHHDLGDFRNMLPSGVSNGKLDATGERLKSIQLAAGGVNPDTGAFCTRSNQL